MSLSDTDHPVWSNLLAALEEDQDTTLRILIRFVRTFLLPTWDAYSKSRSPHVLLDAITALLDSPGPEAIDEVHRAISRTGVEPYRFAGTIGEENDAMRAGRAKGSASLLARFALEHIQSDEVVDELKTNVEWKVLYGDDTRRRARARLQEMLDEVMVKGEAA